MKCVSIFLNTADELPINFKFSAAYLINSAIHNLEQKTIRIFELDGRVDPKLSCESRIKIHSFCKPPMLVEKLSFSRTS